MLISSLFHTKLNLKSLVNSRFTSIFQEINKYYFNVNEFYENVFK